MLRHLRPKSVLMKQGHAWKVEFYLKATDKVGKAKATALPTKLFLLCKERISQQVRLAYDLMSWLFVYYTI